MAGWKWYRERTQRSDGNYVVSDLYCAAFLHAAFIIEPGARFEADLEGWCTNQPIRVGDFLDSAYALKACVKR
jgi:hypothetical protein